MKKLLVVAIVLLCFTSCGKLLEPLYVHLPGTEWVYEQEGKRAYISFGHDDSATVLQKDLTNGAVQQNQGTYVADGHSVVISCTDGTSFKLIRTFTNMKNSKNKNMSRIFPSSPSILAGTVWAGVDMSDLYIYFFEDEENLVKTAFTVTQYEEGVPYGWNKETLPYTRASGTVTADGKTGWLFSDALLTDGIWHVTFPALSGSGNSDLAGTVWYNLNGTSTSAGIIIFNTGFSFIRVQVVNSKTQFLFEQGTYTKNGAVVTMTLNGIQDNCTIQSDGSFRFMERRYSQKLN